MCEYCENGNITENVGVHGVDCFVHINGDSLNVCGGEGYCEFNISMLIKYCPMCGERVGVKDV